jgi:hypothetical protein
MDENRLSLKRIRSYSFCSCRLSFQQEVHRQQAENAEKRADRAQDEASNAQDSANEALSKGYRLTRLLRPGQRRNQAWS